MDIQRQIKKSSVLKKYWYVGVIAMLVIASISFRYFLGDTTYFIARSEFQVAEVQQGEFKVEVRGVGRLKPKDIRLIASQVSGRVEQTFVKPGSYVAKGDLLAKLVNPSLTRDLKKSEWELKATSAEMNASIVQLESQLVDLQNGVKEAKYNYQSTKLRLDAEQSLINQGGSSISQIDFKRTQLSVEQHKQKLDAQKSKVEKMENNIKASKSAHQARLALAQNNYQQAKELVEFLAIRANQSGIVQDFSLQLGQQINTGESVAILADPNSLLAEVQIQELQIRDIALGQPVIVDTRSTQINGVVKRISPKVESGMVTIDVDLSGKLPKEARPDLNIEAKVVINQLSNSLFVQRPAFSPRNTQVKLFKISEDKLFANRLPVQLGISSVNQIQIVEGLKAGDQIIISDMSKYQKHKQLLLN